MLKILIFTMVAISAAIGQPIFTYGEDIIGDNGNGYWISDSDSVYFQNDSLYIHGAETLEVYINTNKTLGMVKLYGTAHALGTDSGTVYFDVSQHRGDGGSRHDEIPETFYAMDSCKIDTSGTDSLWYVNPFDNTNLEKKHTAFYTLRIYGIASYKTVLWMKEERVRGF